eukprot:2929541-Rhodomonas_salina.4
MVLPGAREDRGGMDGDGGMFRRDHAGCRWDPPYDPPRLLRYVRDWGARIRTTMKCVASMASWRPTGVQSSGERELDDPLSTMPKILQIANKSNCW